MVGLRSDVYIQNCYMVITIFVMSKGNCTKKQKEVTLVTGVQYCSRFLVMIGGQNQQNNAQQNKGHVARPYLHDKADFRIILF